jgi:alkylated DNA repair dioxygenase AlkB
MLHYRPWSALPELKAVLKQLQEDGFDFNHVIGTLYTEPTDCIGAHADEMVDIEPATDIVSLSLGDSREFVLAKDGTEDVTVVLNAGDLFVLGPETNATMKHAVQPVKKEIVIDRSSTGFQPRISIVLRKIHAEYTRAEVMAKIKRAGRDAVKRDAVKAAKIGEMITRV